MSVLKVPGAELHYEVNGTGPLLLLITGSNGGGAIFDQMAASLSPNYRVVTYDRRGYSRSKLADDVDANFGLAADASDARHLIEHLSDSPALIFGTDSGAIVALEALKRFSQQVAKALVHEPVLVKLLPEASRWKAFFNEVYQAYRQGGVPRAMHLYASNIGSPDHRLLMPYLREREQSGDRGWGNAAHWMEHELRQYSEITPDISAFADHTSQLVLVGGQDSQNQLTYQPNKILAEKLGLKIFIMPGGHFGYLSGPTDFSRELYNLLTQQV